MDNWCVVFVDGLRFVFWIWFLIVVVCCLRVVVIVYLLELAIEMLQAWIS